MMASLDGWSIAPRTMRPTAAVMNGSARYDRAWSYDLISPSPEPSHSQWYPHVRALFRPISTLNPFWTGLGTTPGILLLLVRIHLGLVPNLDVCEQAKIGRAHV